MTSIRKDYIPLSDFSGLESGKGYNSITQSHPILISRTKPHIVKAGQRNVNVVPSGILGQFGIFLEFLMNSNTPDIEFVVEGY